MIVQKRLVQNWIWKETLPMKRCAQFKARYEKKSFPTRDDIPSTKLDIN